MWLSTKGETPFLFHFIAKFTLKSDSKPKFISVTVPLHLSFSELRQLSVTIFKIELMTQEIENQKIKIEL